MSPRRKSVLGATSLRYLLSWSSYSAEMIGADEGWERKALLLSWPFGARQCQGNVMVVVTQWPSSLCG